MNDPFDSTTISDNFIHSIYEDKQGTLWVGTSLGLNRFDREKQQFHSINTMPIGVNHIPLQDMAVTSIIQDEQNRYWLGTHRNGVVLLDLKSTEIAQL